MRSVALASWPTSYSPLKGTLSDCRSTAAGSFPGTCSPVDLRSEAHFTGRRAANSMGARPRGTPMIDGELEELLRPLERFESIRRRAVRLGDRLCDLSYANPYGGALESARAVLINALA